MIYKIDSSKSKVEFLAKAPLHKFKGWIEDGFEGEIDIDFENNTIEKINIIVKTEFFDTGDRLKNGEMHKYIKNKEITETSFTLKKFKKMKEKKTDSYDISLLGILNFMDIERDVELSIKAKKIDNRLIANVSFDWSFKNFGLKPPQILFIKVKDVVKISVDLEFVI